MRQFIDSARDVAFSDVVEHSAFGPRFSSADYDEEGNVATLRTTDLEDDGRIHYEAMPRARLEESRFVQHFLQPGDLVITRSGTCGIAAVFDGFALPVLPGAFLLRFRLNERADPRYVAYYFNSTSGRRHILSVAQGAVQQNLSITNVEALRLKLPPVEAQRQVAATLRTYDDLIDNNRRRIKLLEDSVRLLFDEWFVRLQFPGHAASTIIDGVPTGWLKVALDEVLLLQRGFDLPSQDREAGDVPIYGSTGVVGFHNKARASGPGLVTGRSGSLGEVHFVAQDFWPLNTALWVKEFKRATPLFALHLLRGMNLRQYNGGVSVPTLDRKVVHKAEVLLPAASIMERFESVAEDVYRQINTLTALNEKLRTARDLLLPRLMSGELTA